jgi:hypothetical protein
MDGHLTEQQRRFVIHLASDSCSAAEAARRAGYSQNSAKEIASQLLRKDHVAAAVRKEQARVLGTLGGKALKVIGDILDDANAPLGVKLDASKTVLDRIGLVAARTPAHAAAIDDRPLNEMSMDELRALLAAIEIAKANQQPVTVDKATDGSASADWRQSATGQSGGSTSIN